MLTKYIFAFVLASVAFVQAAPAGNDREYFRDFKGLVVVPEVSGSHLSLRS